MDAVIENLKGTNLCTVYNLICRALKVDEDGLVQLNDHVDSVSSNTGVYEYIMNNNVLWALNNAIQDQSLKSENEMQDINE